MIADKRRRSPGTRGRGDLVGVRDAPERDVAHHSRPRRRRGSTAPFGDPLVVRFERISPDLAGDHRVHPDAARSELRRQYLRRRQQTGLRRGVRATSGRAPPRRLAVHHHDRAASVLGHPPCGLHAHRHRADEIDLEHRSPVVVGDVDGGRHRSHRGTRCSRARRGAPFGDRALDYLARRSAATVMSLGTVIAPAPRARTSSATASMRAVSRATSTTFVPISANASTIARPNPGPTPDTIATRVTTVRPLRRRAIRCGDTAREIGGEHLGGATESAFATPRRVGRNGDVRVRPQRALSAAGARPR